MLNKSPYFIRKTEAGWSVVRVNVNHKDYLDDAPPRKRASDGDRSGEGRAAADRGRTQQRKEQAMKLTRPIPKEAAEVVKIIRKDVKRPKELPKPTCSENGEDTHLRFNRLVCPMGLHPNAITETPCTSDDFGCDCITAEVAEFGEWWDEQTNAKAAVEAVWPTKKKRK